MKWQSIAAILALASPAVAENAVAPTKCSACAAWNVPQRPFRIYGNSYYVGTHALSAILIASDDGLILIDGALPETAPQIAASIRALGFDPREIKLILNSHAHFDHAGGIAWLQHLSGARVAVSPWSAQVLRHGVTDQADPQYGMAPAPMTPVQKLESLSDGQILRVGTLAVTAHFTPGHTPGGTSWSWVSCEQARCLHLVYGDSLTAVSSDSYRYTAHPDLLRGFQKSFATLEELPCDILLTPHPGFSAIMEKLKARDSGNRPDSFVNAQACRTYALNARGELQKRVSREETGHK